MIDAECTVMNCTHPTKLYWSTGESAAEYADWGVCPSHHARLRAGADFATHNDLPNSAGRWLVMGQDLALRDTDAMQAALVSFEYTGRGKELEIEITTGKQTFDVILDQAQADALGEVVADMNTFDAVRRPDVPQPEAF
jgi:hypothetical protein